MEHYQTLIIGAGVSGLAFANFSTQDDYLIIEAESEIGGYCRTIKQDGFVWDYSGHFFHFRHPEIENYLVSRMASDRIERITRRSMILYKQNLIEFPFQKNIHQLPKEDFIDCLYDLYFKQPQVGTTLRERLYQDYGAGICERFLIPYNEKLYACDLRELDWNALGRFFPDANLTDIISNFKHADNSSYNATFTYPSGGAIEFINPLKSTIPDGKISVNEKLINVDIKKHIALTNRRSISYETVVSSAPFNNLLKITGIQHDPAVFRSNKVLVFNLGFDKKGWTGIHWLYAPEKAFCFYRVGFYDNLFDSDRMSLYVEIGLRGDEAVDHHEWLQRVLIDLKVAGIVTDHRLISYHSVVLNPAYVHITRNSQSETTRLMEHLNQYGIYSIGRYGGWKYCGIEDNILEAMGLVEKLENHPVTLAAEKQVSR